LHFFLFNIVVIFIVPLVFVIEIGTRGVVTEAFIAAYPLVVVTVRMLEVMQPRETIVISSGMEVIGRLLVVMAVS